VSLLLILALALGLGVVWRLVRFAVRVGLLFALIAVIAVYATRSSHSHSATSPPAGARARVAHVADGDTLTALTSHGPVRVRLLGIDAPELTSTRFGYPTCDGRAPRATSERLLRPARECSSSPTRRQGPHTTASTGCWRTWTARTAISARRSCTPARRSSTATTLGASRGWLSI
jgi:hypothetical protein